ncbi:MAG: hypothetical protein DI613_07385 [Kocuria rhizophila]|nr:TraV family lipoprotein [uncultured Sphingomonas sp.]PZP33168.1 MAG: hypothetical protein DI613_07385 [Kocuria rhizophila]
MSARLHTLAAILAGTLLSGCMTMGGSVKGDFVCRAPDGVCAPSSLIDDRALALILGEAPEGQAIPAGPYTPAPRASSGLQVADANPARTSEKVLRIVFPSHIDASGRLYEQTAVHAVVQGGDWQSASAGTPVATTPVEVAASASGGPLFAAVDRVSVAMNDTGEAGYQAVDPDAPSAAAVAAARARAADPIGDIKAQVAGKLSARPPRVHPPRIVVSSQALAGDAAVSVSAPGGARPTAPKPVEVSQANPPAAQPVVAPRTLAAAAPATSVRGTPRPPALLATPAHATPAGKAAIATLQADPALGAGIAGMSGAVTAAKPPVALPILRAPSFPGAPQ